MGFIWKNFYKYWMRFAHILGAINGRIILFIFYFVIISLYAIISFPFRILKNHKESKTEKESYWVEKNQEKMSEEILLRQF